MEISWRRYDRQLHDLGVEGQLKLRASSVLITGLGGLGSIAAVYLVSAGVGRIYLVDRDKVEETNLNRQIIYTPSDIGKEKAIVAKEKLKILNPEVEIEAFVMDVFSEDYEKLVERATLIIDGMDGWRQRFRINELAVRYKKPLVHAAVESWYGQLMVVVPYETPCLHCVFTHVRDKAYTRIIGPVAGIVGLMEALEAIKLIVGKGELVVNKLLVINLKNMSFDYIKLKRNPNCPVCGMKS